jgi:hypothetical protein
MVVEWVLSTIGNSAAIAISAQLTLTETVGFECSNSGLSVLAKLSRTSDEIVQTEGIKLIIGKSEIGLDSVFMLETAPQFWAGTISDTQSAIPLIAASTDFTVIVPGRIVQLDFDKVKMQNFISACQEKIGKS